MHIPKSKLKLLSMIIQDYNITDRLNEFNDIAKDCGMRSGHATCDNAKNKTDKNPCIPTACPYIEDWR